MFVPYSADILKCPTSPDKDTAGQNYQLMQDTRFLHSFSSTLFTRCISHPGLGRTRSLTMIITPKKISIRVDDCRAQNLPRPGPSFFLLTWNAFPAASLNTWLQTSPASNRGSYYCTFFRAWRKNGLAIFWFSWYSLGWAYKSVNMGRKTTLLWWKSVSGSIPHCLCPIPVWIPH